MFGLLKKIFGTPQTRKLKKYARIVKEINQIEEKLEILTDDALRAKTAEFKKRIADGASVDSLLPEAYAVVKNACRRLCGQEVNVFGYEQRWDMIPYDVQLLGAIALHYGSIAEMQTGEGKTLTASLPLYLNALTGKPVHLVTVNDYLVKRDSDWIGAIFNFLGLNVAALTSQVPVHSRKEVYEADIVYGTASEFGFDYLRDNSMAQNAFDECQRGHYFAIVDEIDSILIDEARTPLIISGPSATSFQMYAEVKDRVAEVVKVQRDLCNKMATDAKRVLDQFEGKKQLTSAEQKQVDEAFKKLWLVGKGTPQNKVLRKLKEDPEKRAKLEEWNLYYLSEPNKQERISHLATLLVIIEERSSDFELTDLGTNTFIELSSTDPHATSFFEMLDLGHEYAQIESSSLSDPEKIEAKVRIREEDSKRKERSHNLRQLMRAHLLMEKDVDYIVEQQKIVIIDENTGRPQPGRRFSDGLHQAIEAKENVPIQGETQTYATITLQNYFRMYDKLSGMTGTAMTEAGEFQEIYKIDVLSVPTYKECRRTDVDTEMYMTEREKYQALLKEIQKIHDKGGPILIGTESVDVSEKLSRILKQHKLEHNVLNAKNHAQEAQIIADAGRKGAITIATNMAGRGTDIKLKDGVAEFGGLHVISTTHHTSRRIDRQLRGRSGRLGDPGFSKFFISFEDDLMRMFTSPKITGFLQRFRPPEGEPIQAKILNSSIETAQKRVEQRNYSIRKHTLEYDDVFNKQRQEIYGFRRDILHTDEPLALAKQMVEKGIDSIFATHMQGSNLQEDSLKAVLHDIMTHFPINVEESDLTGLDTAGIIEKIKLKIARQFETKMRFHIDEIDSLHDDATFPEEYKTSPDSLLNEILRNILIRTLDRMWQEHLLHVDHLRTEVSLRVIGQKDPLIEFKHEAFALFERLISDIALEISHAVFRFQVAMPKPQAPQRIENPFKMKLGKLDNQEILSEPDID